MMALPVILVLFFLAFNNGLPLHHHLCFRTTNLRLIQDHPVHYSRIRCIDIDSFRYGPSQRAPH